MNQLFFWKLIRSQWKSVLELKGSEFSNRVLNADMLKPDTEVCPVCKTSVQQLFCYGTSKLGAYGSLFKDLACHTSVAAQNGTGLQGQG